MACVRIHFTRYRRADGTFSDRKTGKRAHISYTRTRVRPGRHWSSPCPK